MLPVGHDPADEDESHRHENNAVVADGENRRGSWLAASECVAQIADLHAFAQERHARHGDAVARLQPVHDFDLAARRLADFHRAARDGSDPAQ